jgi:hypothetical protein
LQQSPVILVIFWDEKTIIWDVQVLVISPSNNSICHVHTIVFNLCGGKRAKQQSIVTEQEVLLWVVSNVFVVLGGPQIDLFSENLICLVHVVGLEAPVIDLRFDDVVSNSYKLLVLGEHVPSSIEVVNEIDSILHDSSGELSPPNAICFLFSIFFLLESDRSFLLRVHPGDPHLSVGYDPFRPAPVSPVLTSVEHILA